ncbi:hypothetical protein A2U01_0069969, partial [Trifolium medium]|nr:hypothetical protein [Trifolium medium]
MMNPLESRFQLLFPSKGIPKVICIEADGIIPNILQLSDHIILGLIPSIMHHITLSIGDLGFAPEERIMIRLSSHQVLHSSLRK